MTSNIIPSLSVMIKPVSGLCNMRCDYCFYCDEAEKREQASFGLMSERTLKNIIRRTLTHVGGSYTLAFQGGEPTLRGLPFLKQAVAYIEQYNQHHAKINYALQTNGFSLTEEMARFFCEQHFLIGVSIDGLPEIHDRYRHPGNAAKTRDSNVSPERGTFARTAGAVGLLEKYQVDYNILTVVHKETAERIREIYRFYKEKGWNYLQFIPCLDPLNEAPGKQEYSLLPGTYGRFLIDLFDCWYEDFLQGQAPYIRQFDNYLGMILGYRPEACDQRGHCGLQYAVEADGSVYPCDFYMLDEWKLGNFNTDRLDAIDRERFRKQFIERSDPLPEKCRGCEWLALCRGGCYRHWTSSLQNPEGVSAGLNYFCESYRMFFEACYERLKRAATAL